MDPSAPRPATDPADLERLHRVQRIVASALVYTTVLHLAVGFVLAADHLADGHTDAQVVLVTLGAVSLVLGVAAVLAINRRPVWSPWLLAGLLPGLVGWWWVFQR